MENILSGLANGQINGQQQYSGQIAGTGTFSGIPLLDMKPGDMFKGEIVSVNGEEVQLKLAPGQYLAARLEGQVQLALGQMLTFQVQSNKDSRIVLKPVYTNLLQQQVGFAALKAAGLPANDKNLQLVTQLLDNGMPIDKNSLANVYRQVLLHPNADINEIMSLVKLDIPVTDGNIQQYTSYKNLEHQLLGGIEEAAKEIFTSYDSIDTNSGIHFMEKVIMLLEENGKQEYSTNLTADNTVTNGQNTIETDRIMQPVSSKTTVEDTNIINQSGEENKPAQIAEAQRNVDDKITDNNINDKESALHEIINTIKEAVKEGNARTDIKPLNLSSMINVLSDTDKHALFKSEHFREYVREKLLDNWTLTADDVRVPEKVKEFYARLLNESGRLARIMQETVQSDTAVNNHSAQNLHDNIDFMNSVNHVFTYIQLPLKLSNSKAQGELYVYTNKKNLAKKEGALTALLHLDMEHLGKMDVNITLQTQNNSVTTGFYIQEELISFLEQHMDELTDRLVGKGYIIKSYVTKYSKEKNIVDIMEEQVAGKTAPLSYQAFDMRT